MKSLLTRNRAAARLGRSILWTAIAGTSTLLATYAARAQDALAQTAAVQPTPNPAGQLQEVTVTANRFEESIEKVPITMTAVTGAQLQELNIVDVDDVFKTAPDVLFYRTGAGGGSNSELVVRGINSSIGAGTTGVYIDDTAVQLHRGGLSFTAQNGYPDIFDLDRVEILEGPQGTLFGTGAMGGAVRFITRQPSLNAYSLYAKAENSFTYAGDPSYGLGFAVGGPIVDDQLGFRFSADYHRDGGWVTHTSRYAAGLQYQIEQSGQGVVNGPGGVGGPLPSTTFFPQPFSNYRETSALRGAVTWQPIEGLLITPSFTWQNIYQGAQSSFFDFYSNPDAGKFVNASGDAEPEYDRFILPTLTVRYDLPGVDLFSSTSFYIRDERNYYDTTQCTIECTPAGFIPVSYPNYFPEYPTLETNLHDYNQQRNFSEELRGQSADASARLTWQGGIYLARDVAKSQEFVFLDLNTINAVAAALGKATGHVYTNYLQLFCCSEVGNVEYQTIDLVIDKHAAAFGEVNYELIPALKLTLGMRIEHVSSSLTSEQAGPYAGYQTLTGFTAEVSNTMVTPKFSAAYQINSGNMAYATVAKGERPGGSNGVLPAFCGPSLAASGLGGFTGAFDPDYVWSYEVGAKDRFADNRVLLNSSIYLIKWNKIQEQQFLTGQCIEQITFNGNSLTSKGFSLQGTVLVGGGLRFEGSLGYDKALFDEPTYGGAAPGGGRTIVINKDDGIDGAPPLTASMALQYDRDLFSRPYFARIDYQHIGAENRLATTDPATTAYFPLTRVRPVTNVGNFRMGMTFDRFQAQFFITNFTNAHPLYQTSNGQLDGVTTESITIRPRTLGVTGLYNF